MKWFFIILIASVMTSKSHALSFEVSYQGESLYTVEGFIMNLSNHLGISTVELLNKSGLDYEGGTYGVKSILNFGNKIVKISDTEMKAYGWCFSIDSQVPETMIDETYASSQETHLRWFYAYAHFKNDHWIAQCQEDI